MLECSFYKDGDFNPRSRVGNDIFATGSALIACYFNPRSRGGNDDRFIPFPDFVAISIHVPAWGTTIMAAILAPLNLNFNPRSRVGNDRSSCAETNDINDFNQRSRVGNDCKVGDTVYVPTRFQSTFPRGERQ